MRDRDRETLPHTSKCNSVLNLSSRISHFFSWKRVKLGRQAEALPSLWKLLSDSQRAFEIMSRLLQFHIVVTYGTFSTWEKPRRGFREGISHVTDITRF